MVRAFGYIVSGALLLSTIQSCKRQYLCELTTQSDTSSIQLSIDWNQSGIDKEDIYNVSIYAYPEDGSSPYLKVSGSIESTYINLPAGIYTLLVFNDIAGDLMGLNFYGMNSYDEARIEMKEQNDSSDLYYNFTDDEILMSDHSELAAWRMSEFEVTPEMVSCWYCDGEQEEAVEVNLDVAPTPVTTPCIVKIRVENLYNANIIQGVLRGFADGIYISDEKRYTIEGVDNLYGIDFVKRIYDDTDYIDGEVEAEIATFGKSPNDMQSYELIIDVIVNSGERLTFVRDVTDQVNGQDNTGILIELNLDDDKIVLPDGQGMGFGVESWGDRESVELL